MKWYVFSIYMCTYSFFKSVINKRLVLMLTYNALWKINMKLHLLGPTFNTHWIYTIFEILSWIFKALCVAWQEGRVEKQRRLEHKCMYQMNYWTTNTYNSWQPRLLIRTPSKHASVFLALNAIKLNFLWMWSVLHVLHIKRCRQS